MGATFMLDEHFSPTVIDMVASLEPDITVHAVSTYRDGELRGEPDEALLAYCHKHSFVLVTADVATIPPVLKEWADIGKTHGGVVFISHKSIRANNHPRIAKGIVQLAQEVSQWTDIVYFMRAAN